ncbi:Zn(II)2Cys6 transcription factor [Aspergillus undulatus]|uniref:Zn(II)2Cys6 transcription factor n=1 Tax=Aspergillus undulatus TaxID=1810928 RepID=UPI003CCCE872
MRPSSACDTCRLRKRKCIVTGRSRPCTLCVLKGLDCSFIATTQMEDFITPHHQENSLAGPGGGGPCAWDYPPPDVRRELVDLYFDLVHDKQHIIFHRYSFIQEQQQGRAANFLVLGMIALMARFSSNPYFEDIQPRDRAAPWLQRAIQAFNARPNLIDIQSLQGCILLAFVAFVEGDSAQDTLLSAQAVRMVQVLHLPVVLSPGAIQRETEIRLYWQTWMMETWDCVQAQLPAQLQSNPQFPRPLEESVFSSMRCSQEQDRPADCQIAQRGPQGSGIWSLILPLTEMHGLVVRLNDQLTHGTFSQSEIHAQVESLSCKLESWLGSLPRSMRNTPSNRKMFSDQGLLQEFINMHLLYHHQSQLLYYQFLHQAVSSEEGPRDDPESKKYAGLCKLHATALSEIMWDMNLANTPCVWSPLNGHLLVIASSVHLHSML